MKEEFQSIKTANSHSRFLYIFLHIFINFRLEIPEASCEKPPFVRSHFNDVLLGTLYRRVCL